MLATDHLRLLAHRWKIASAPGFWATHATKAALARALSRHMHLVIIPHEKMLGTRHVFVASLRLWSSCILSLTHNHTIASTSKAASDTAPKAYSGGKGAPGR